MEDKSPPSQKTLDLQRFHKYISAIEKNPERIFMRFQPYIEKHGYLKFLNLFQRVDSNYDQSSMNDKIILLLLATSLMNCFYKYPKSIRKQADSPREDKAIIVSKDSSSDDDTEEDNSEELESFFSKKVKKIHQDLVDEAALTDQQKIGITALVGKAFYIVKDFYEAETYYTNTIKFIQQSAVNGAFTSVHTIRKYFMVLSSCYFDHGYDMKKAAPDLANVFYILAIDFAKEAQRCSPESDELNKVWFCLMKATYELAALRFRKALWGEALNLYMDAIKISVEGLKTDMNTEKQKDIFLDYLKCSFQNLHSIIRTGADMSEQWQKTALENIAQLNNLLFSMMPNQTALIELKAEIATVTAVIESSKVDHHYVKANICG